MAMMGHTGPTLALEVYARKMERGRDTGARMDSLIRGAEWTPDGQRAGTNGAETIDTVLSLVNENPA
jgi:hypothetical protein